MKVLVEASAHHVHLSEKDAKALFGYSNLTKVRDLSQPGQFLCSERVNVIGPKGEIKNVAVLGPCRKQTQVEVSFTESIKLGIKGIIRESGDLKMSEKCEIASENGKVYLEEGVIVAKRHIHVDSKTAEESNLDDGRIVRVKIKSNQRSLIFDDVVVRVNEKFSLAMHIDTDEANACGFFAGMIGEIML